MDAEHQQRRQRLEEASLPLMLDALWAGNVLDIETTLRHVCKKVRLLPVIVLCGSKGFDHRVLPRLINVMPTCHLQSGAPAASQQCSVACLHEGGALMRGGEGGEPQPNYVQRSWGRVGWMG